MAPKKRNATTTSREATAAAKAAAKKALFATCDKVPDEPLATKRRVRRKGSNCEDASAPDPVVAPVSSTDNSVSASLPSSSAQAATNDKETDQLTNDIVKSQSHELFPEYQRSVAAELGDLFEEYAFGSEDGDPEADQRHWEEWLAARADNTTNLRDSGSESDASTIALPGAINDSEDATDSVSVAECARGFLKFAGSDKKAQPVPPPDDPPVPASSSAPGFEKTSSSSSTSTWFRKDDLLKSAGEDGFLQH